MSTIRRRTACVAVMLFMLSAGLFAAPLLQVGGRLDFTDGFGIGVELRVSPMDLVSITVPADLRFPDGGFSIGTSPSVNVNVPLLLVDAFVGAGVDMDFLLDDGSWTMNGRPLEEFKDTFGSMCLLWRAGVTVNLLPFGVGVSAEVPSKGPFSDFDPAPDWDRTSVSCSILFSFF